MAWLPSDLAWDAVAAEGTSREWLDSRVDLQHAVRKQASKRNTITTITHSLSTHTRSFSSSPTPPSFLARTHTSTRYSREHRALRTAQALSHCNNDNNNNHPSPQFTMGRRAFCVPALVTGFLAFALLLLSTISTPLEGANSSPFYVVQGTGLNNATDGAPGANEQRQINSIRVSGQTSSCLGEGTSMHWVRKGRPMDGRAHFEVLGCMRGCGRP